MWCKGIRSSQWKETRENLSPRPGGWVRGLHAFVEMKEMCLSVVKKASLQFSIAIIGCSPSMGLTLMACLVRLGQKPPSYEVTI